MSAYTATIAPETRLRLTVRGRRVLAFLVAAPIAVLLTYGLISGGAALASRDNGATVPFSVVTVSYGDTLWSIAQEVAPTSDPRDVVDAIARLNALPGGLIEIGQTIAIPAEYSTAQ
ncbi:LysM peptidoglycan-binding domain-containing protein [Microbacterium sp. SLBN-146]|uniref:LysM peptidoglycan-binding domain-containing protein n=1 Tax=Microbacterium sp. SLBN-146 TaxID=2768457 RepID=UPI001154D517|nr:LysM peptidoglycan-binding domain-containing protein [Microbacterium sp. SLBN-146]TQJ32466.1 LysM domain-containing protein [Microbacterium sp. SLBN-146]